MKLFTARTIEKTFLFESDSRQDFLRMLCDRMEKTPAPIVEYDARQHPVPAFPYTLWKREKEAITGYPYKTMGEIL